MPFVMHHAGEEGELDLSAQAGYAHEPYLEWAIGTTEFSGNEYDVAATATFTPRGGGTPITMPLFYAGSNTFKFRFTGPRVEVYDVLVTSAHAGLNGITTRADITSNPNADARGYLTSVANADGTGSFAYLHGDAGTPRRTLYNSWMRWATMTSPPGANIISDVSSTAGTRATHIEALLDGMIAHGLQTFEIVIGHNFVQYPRTSTQTSTNTTPSDTTFTILEDWLERAHARGLALHVWKWLDNEAGGSAANLVDGINGYVDLRVQRYLVGRLGCFPNLTISYSYDLEEWVTPEQVRAWRDNLQALSNVPRLLFARESQERYPSPVFDLGGDRLNVFSWDGRPTNGTDISEHTFWHDAQNPLELYAKPDGRPAGLPMMYEGRFFINRPNRPSTYTYTEANTRRLLWQASMANGVASIIGSFKSPYDVDYAYPERFRTLTLFLGSRFHEPLDVVSSIDGVAVDGRALANTTGSLQVLYKENASSITVRVPTGMSDVSVIAQDTLAAHNEVNLGTYDAGTHTIQLGSTSDWAVAVGNFGAAEPTALYVSLTGNDDTGTGSIGNPYRSLPKAVSVVQAGQTIYLRDGVYDVLGEDVYLSGYPGSSLIFSGTEAEPITVRSYPGEWAIIDGKNHARHPRTENDGYDTEDPNLLRFIGEWVTWQDLEMRNGVGKGFHVTGNYNTIKHMRVHHVHSDALYIQGAYNHIEDWLGHDVWSASIGGNAGDSIKLHDGSQIETWALALGWSENSTHHNTMLRCGAHNCCDDGFDTISAKNQTWTDCWAFNCGFGPTGNGQGYKMGGSAKGHDNTAVRCIAAYNKVSGFTPNGGARITMHQSTAWGNEIGFDARSSAHDGGEPGNIIVRDNISYANDYNISRGGSPPYQIVEHNLTTDPAWISTDPAHADFLGLSAGSDARGYGSAGQDVGALQYAAQFPNAWPLVLDTSKRGGTIPTIPEPEE